MQRQDRDPYEVLGLDAAATFDEIKAAYRRLAMKHHPDKNSGDKASEWIFREVNRAYEILQDIRRGNRSSGRHGARRERQGDERAEQEAKESDARTREQARRERQAQEDRRRREQFVKESERRWARAEQERQRREQEDEETLRKHWRQFWLVGMPLLLLFFIAYDDEDMDIEGRMVVWVGLALFGLTTWLIQFVARAARKSASSTPDTCRVTYCENCHRIGRRRFTNDRSQCLHCKGGLIVTRVCASERAAEDFIAEFQRHRPNEGG